MRHQFARIFLSNYPGIQLINTFVETGESPLKKTIQKDVQPGILRQKHLIGRSQTEKDFFELYVNQTEDRSNPVFIKRGEINLPEYVNRIINAQPDLLIAYGCSIIRSELLSVFEGRFINMHLGLSPYYRGSGTNFWPFVLNELQFVGTTFMYIDEGIDTGEVIHQIRAKMVPFDNIHQIGNRLIKDSVQELARLIVEFDKIKKMPQIRIEKKEEKVFKKKDFTEESVRQAYNNLCNGMIENYLEHKEEIDSKYPIIQNPALV